MPSKKKVIFLIPTFPVLSETFIEREVYELKKRGNLDFDVVSFSKGSKFNYPQLAGSVKYIKLNFLDIIFGKVYFFANNPKALFVTLGQSLKTQRSILQNLYVWFKSVGYAYKFKQLGCTHIHAHFFSNPSTIAFFAAQLLGVTFGISGHAKDIFDNAADSDSMPELVAQKMAYARYAALCNKKAYETCVNKTNLKDRNKIHLMYHGMDFALLPHIQSSEKMQLNVPIVYYVGRFVEKKGLMYLLEAAKMLKDAGEKVKVVMAGFGPEYCYLHDYVLSNGLEDYVMFVNNGKGIDNFTALEYMNAADIVAVPAVDLAGGDSDGLPNIILEAGMLSKPVITTLAGSISELIKDGHNGLVIEQRSESSLAEGIVRLLHDKEFALSLGMQLHSDVKSKFDLSTNIVALENLIRSASEEESVAVSNA